MSNSKKKKSTVASNSEPLQTNAENQPPIDAQPANKEIETQRAKKENPPQQASDVLASNDDADQQAEPYVDWRRTDYYKYQKIKTRLIDLLKPGNFSADFIAQETNIAKGSTFPKYKALAQLETGLILMTKEERDYLEANLPPEQMAKMDELLEAQNEKKGS